MKTHAPLPDPLPEIEGLPWEAQVREIRYDAIRATVRVLGHDIHRPLALLFTGLAMLEEEQDPTALHAMVQQLTEELQKASDHVQGRLADLANLDLFSPLPHRRLIACHPIMSEVMTSVNLILRPARGVEVTQERETEAIQTFAHPDMFKRIVEILYENAIRATPPRGRIAWHVQADHDQGMACKRFTCHNTGSFIPSDLQETLFDPFTSHWPTPAKGLGLAIAQKLVRDHGGRLWCESHPHTGTAFIFTLPDKVSTL